MTWQGKAAGAVALSLSLVSCSANRLALHEWDALTGSSSVFVGAEDFPSQRVFRVRYQGGGEQGSFRVILRFESPTRYRLSALNPVGRPLWEVDYAEPRTAIFDHRNRVTCVAEGPVAVEAASLSVVPVDDLPAVLLGRLPASLREGGTLAGRHRWVDGRGRRWSVETAAGRVEAWTLWQDDRPLAWYRRLDDGGMLSHRLGEQFRWQQTVSEPLPTPLPHLEVPPAWQRRPCRELDLVD